MKRKGVRKGRVGAAVKSRREKAGVRGGGTTLGRLSRRDEGRTFEVSSGRFFQPPERVAQYQAAPRLTNGRPPAPTIRTSWPATRLDENFPRDTLSGKDTHGPNPRDPLTNRRGEIMYRVARSISVRTWMSIYTCIYSRDRGIRERAIWRGNLTSGITMNLQLWIPYWLFDRSSLVWSCIRNTLELIVIDFRENIKGWNLGIILFVVDRYCRIVGKIKSCLIFKEKILGGLGV